MNALDNHSRNVVGRFVVATWLGLVASIHADPPPPHPDPQLGSWFMAYSGKYARIYQNDAARLAGTTVTTWSNGTQSQNTPTYCGVQEIYSSEGWIYLRSTGLGSHVMGPWYNNAARTVTFPNLPVNQKAFYRIPRTFTLPDPPSVKSSTAGEAVIGYFVDGVAMFDALDGWSWTGSSEQNSGNGQWNRDAYVNEGVTFDPSNTHQQNTGTYHNHANPIALRYLLNDNVDFNSSTKLYSESTNAPTRHSPILGWLRDGYPIYGPYGFSDPMDSASGVRRMVGGFALRNGQNGTDNLTTGGRGSLPAWMLRNNGNQNQAGPSVNSNYPLGRYVQDNAYLGDLTNPNSGQPYQFGVDFDLNEYGTRYCVTPEFPDGTWAYFVCITSNGTPMFPYNVGRFYFGHPVGGKITNLTENVMTNFMGASGPSRLEKPTVNSGDGTITLRWASVEGGTYRVESSDTLTNWSNALTNVLSQGVLTQTNVNGNGSEEFYRITRTALATFDPVSTNSPGGGGGGSTSVAPGGSASRGTTVTITITLPTNPPRPPSNVVPASATLAGSISGTSISRPSVDTVQATFVIPANAPTGAQNVVVTFNSPGPTYTLTGGFTIN